MSGNDPDRRDAAHRVILPIGLRVYQRSCLVVGGGRVAFRKTRSLLDAGARVTVISPTLDPGLRDLATADRIRHLSRCFSPSDIAESFLVIAATGEPAVNAAVVDACRRARILTGAVDHNWRQGDFVSPALVRHDDLTIAVSTGGTSCRRSKLVKNSLARHIAMLDTAEPLILGTGHHHLAIRDRAPFHLNGERLDQVGAMLAQVRGVHEFTLLNTCNRIELIAVTARTAAIDALLTRIMGFDRLSAGEYSIKRGPDAFNHLALLSAGLLSQTPGENHIVAQVKQAVQTARAAGWAAGMITHWLDSALHIAKSIRRDTIALLRQEEIEDLCFQYLADEIKKRPPRGILVIGAGVVGSGLVDRLIRAGQRVTWCYHQRSPNVPADGADRIRICQTDTLDGQLADHDLILCAAGSDRPLLTAADRPAFNQTAKTLIIDLAMPPNVSPELREATDHIQVIDLDDLKHWYRREQADMDAIFQISNRLLDTHREMYEKLLHGFQGRNADKPAGANSNDLSA